MSNRQPSPPRPRERPKSRHSLSFQRSLLRWGDLRRLRKGLVRARRHPLHSGATHLPDDAASRSGLGLSLTHRATRVLIPLLLLVIMLFAGRRFVLQRLDVEKLVRHQVIPQLEAQYHTTIEVGPIESDWLSRLVLHDVVIGRDVQSPFGALARAKTITIGLDIVGLGTRRIAPINAVRAVALDEPQLFLYRNEKGRLNLQDLFTEKKSSGARWSGLVTVRNGRAWYEDHAFKAASGQPLLADARQITAQARLNGEGPIEFTALAGETYLGRDKVLARSVAAQGAAGPDADWATADLKLPLLPAPLLADYAFRKGEVTAQSGAAGGVISFTWEKKRPPNDQITAQGTVQLQNIAASSRQLREPGTGQPLSLSNLNGALTFSGRALQTENLQLNALGSAWRAAGTLALVPQPAFDATIKSDNADTQRLLRIARSGPLQKNALFQQTAIRVGRATLNLHLTGDKSGARFSGRVRVPQLAISHPQWGRAQSAALAAELDGNGDLNGVQMTAKISAPNLTASHARLGTAKGDALQGTVKLAAAKGAPARLEADFASRGVAVQSRGATARFAALGGELSFVATKAPRVAIKNLVATGARASFKESAAQAASLRGNATLAAGRWQSDFAFSEFSGQQKQNLLRAANLRGSAAGDSLNWTQAQIRSDFRAEKLYARAAKQGAVRAASFSGAAFWSQKRLWAKAQAQTLSGQWQNNTLRAGGALVVARYVQDAKAQPVAADVTLSNFSGGTPRYGRVSGKKLRVVATSPDAPKSWSGQAEATALDISKVKLAALSPQAAREISDVGTVDGSVRFAGVGPGRKPRIRGAVRLSQVVLRDVNLRDISAQVDFDGTRLRLADANASSSMGTFNGSVETTLSGGGLRLSLNVEDASLDADLLNPYLKAQNLEVTGIAIGKISVTPRLDGSNAHETRFSFALPSLWLRPVRKNAESALRLDGVQLRGSGLFQFQKATDWNFGGQAQIITQEAEFEGEAGQELDGFGAPQWLHGSRGTALRLSLRGGVARNENGVAPRLAASLEMENASVSLPNAKTATIREARAEILAQPEKLTLTRLTAYTFGGEINGHAALDLDEDGAVRGQILAEKLDAATLRHWAAPFDRNDPQTDWGVRGQAFAQADFSGTRQNITARVQTRLYEAGARWHDVEVPLDAARAVFTIQLPDWKSVPIESLSVWSRGARAAAAGTVTRQNAEFALDIKATLTDWRAATIKELTGFADLQREAGLDGLLSADLQIGGTVRAPQAQGRVAARLAQAFGIGIEKAEGKVSFTSTEKGPRAALTELTGQTEGTPFSGGFEADYAAGVWKANFTTSDLPPTRLLRAADDVADLKKKPVPDAPPQAKFPLRTLPVRGALSARVALSGSLKSPEGAAAFKADDGLVQVQATDLRWRGLPLGNLTADLSLQNGILKTQKLELRRPVPAHGDDEAEEAVWSVSGDLPASPEAKNLNATVLMNGERLAFFFDALEEAQGALKLRDTRLKILDQLVGTVRKLPADLDARINFEARLTGQWSKPRVDVQTLYLSEARARGPLGVSQALPVLDAQFSYDGEAILVRRAALRLPNVRQPGDTEDPEDTVLRVNEGARFEPGGKIALQARVINANLSQLAPWVPALRDGDGSSLLRGELAQFVLSVNGDIESPQVSGAITAENVSFRQYSVDSLRIARFDIANGFLQIERPNFTITKGAFQSSAAWGRVAWDWENPGLQPTSAIEVHLQLGREDLGALSGTFVPALARADAQEFSGALDVTGTLQARQINGELSIKDGSFLLKPATLPVDAGIAGVTGRISFTEGDRVVFSGPDGKLTGRLVPPENIGGRTTGNAPPTSTPNSPAQAARRQMSPKNGDERSARLAGIFSLAGDVQLDLSDPDTVGRPLIALDRHVYNLQLEVRDGQAATGTVPGLRDVNLALLWKTEGAPSGPKAQRLRWLMGAQGQAQKGKPGGAVYGLGALQLAPGFGSSFPALLRSKILLLNGISDFAPFGVHKQITSTAAQKVLGPLSGPQPPRFAFDRLNIGLKNVFSGEVDGLLTLDNRPARGRILPAPPRVSLASRVSSSRQNHETGWIDGDGFLAARPGEAQANVQSDTPSAAPPENVPPPGGDGPIRVAGKLTLSQATMWGTPAGGVTPGAEMPPGPVLDLSLNIGREVEFTVPNVRAVVTGAIDITGTPADPLVSGTVQTPSGQLRFPTTQARILKGELRLSAFREQATGQIRTAVDVSLTARGQVGRYMVTLDVTGPLDLGSETSPNLRVNITSNPPLLAGQAEELLLGKRSGDPTRTEENVSQTLLALVSSPFISGVEQSLQKIFGIDTLALEYRFNEPLTVQVGKAVGEKIYVSYRRVLGSTTTNAAAGTGERWTLRLEYRLKNDLQIGAQQSDLSRRITIEKTWRF